MTPNFTFMHIYRAVHILGATCLQRLGFSIFRPRKSSGMKSPAHPPWLAQGGQFGKTICWEF